MKKRAFNFVIIVSLKFFFCSQSIAEEAKLLHFGNTEKVPSKSTSTLSSDARANTIIFDNVVAAIDSGGKVASATATVVVSIEGGAMKQTLSFDMRGGANIDGKNSCVLYILDNNEIHKRSFRATNKDIFLRWKRPVNTASQIQLSS